MEDRIISTHQKCHLNCSKETVDMGICECFNSLKRGIDLNDKKKI